MSFSRIKWIGAILFVFVLAAVVPSGNAQSKITGDALQGGLLYDNWFYTLDVFPPENENPLWRFQEMNEASGNITWRCSECHGWDYKGKDGVYSTGSHRTDFPGVIDVVDMPVEDIKGWLDGENNPEHDFREYISPSAIDDLVAFLKTKPVNLNRFIDRETGHIYGDGQQGYILYRTKCVNCHGYDGAFLTMRVDGKDNFLSDLAFEDPWRMFHKIRFGQPGVEMPAMEAEGWSMQNISDVLVYIRTLPQLRDEHELEGIEVVRLDYDKQADLNIIVMGAAMIFVVILIGSFITIRRAKKPD